VTEQVEQSDPVALLGERAGDAPVQFGVQQQAVQVDDERAGVRAVHVVEEPVTAVDEREVAPNCDGTHGNTRSGYRSSS
jgi:hypothetical protein